MTKSGPVEQSRSLSILVMLLLALHFLFGVTGIMAALIGHIKLSSTQGTVYHSQLNWLLITYWVAVAGYVATFVIWQQWGLLWPVLIIAAWIIYRLLTHFFYWKHHQPITRYL